MTRTADNDKDCGDGRREIAIKSQKFHCIIANLPHKRIELSCKIATKSHTTEREFSRKIAK